MQYSSWQSSLKLLFRRIYQSWCECDDHIMQPSQRTGKIDSCRMFFPFNHSSRWSYSNTLLYWYCCVPLLHKSPQNEGKCGQDLRISSLHSARAARLYLWQWYNTTASHNVLVALICFRHSHWSPRSLAQLIEYLKNVHLERRACHRLTAISRKK